MRLEIPGFSRYYLETEDNRIYSKYYHPMAERINRGDTNHPNMLLNLIDDNGIVKTVTKHRIVYKAYHPNEDISELQINHLDEDPLNNCPDNLQSCTAVENMNWGTCRERMSKSQIGIPKLATAKSVKATVVSTGEVEYYESIAAAARALNRSAPSISLCCSGKQKAAHGRYWEYYHD